MRNQIQHVFGYLYPTQQKKKNVRTESIINTCAPAIHNKMSNNNIVHDVDPENSPDQREQQQEQHQVHV